jgi:hypothetical protein
MSKINVDAMADRIDRERRKRVMQEARRKAAQRRQRGPLTCVETMYVPEGWVRV